MILGTQANRSRKLLNSSRKRFASTRTQSTIHSLTISSSTSEKVLHGTASSAGTLVASWRTVWHTHCNELHTLMLTTAFRNQALHLLLPRSLCDLAIQDSIDTPSSAGYLSFQRVAFAWGLPLANLGRCHWGHLERVNIGNRLLNTVMQMIWAYELLVSKMVIDNCLAVNRMFRYNRKSFRINGGLILWNWYHGQVTNSSSYNSQTETGYHF